MRIRTRRAVRSVTAAVTAVVTAVVLTGWAAAAETRPDLVGLPLDEAVAVLEEQDLQVELEPSSLPEGTDRGVVVVLGTTQLGDPVEPGGLQGYLLSLGSRVPDVVGQSLASAVQELRASGLQSARLGRASDDPEALLVTAQRQQAGTLLPLERSVGVTAVDAVRVPDVTRLLEPVATAALLEAGLVPVVVSDAEATGPVESQAPAAGELVPEKSTVELSLGVLPEPRVPVPDLVGRTRAEAGALLDELGLTLVVTSPPEATGRVETQRPLAGTLVEPDSRVEVTLAAVAARVTVPDLVGLTLTDARRRVEALDLRLTVTEDRTDDARVASQQPAAGTRVRAGSAVDVTLEAPDTPEVVVPDLRDLSPEEARRRLAEVDLTLEPTIEGDPDEATAVRQSPGAGSSVRAGSSVAVTFEAPSVVDAVVTAAGRPWAGGLVAVLVLGLLSTALLRTVSRTRERRWVREHVHHRGERRSRPASLERPGEQDVSVVRVAVHAEPGRQWVEDVQRA